MGLFGDERRALWVLEHEKKSFDLCGGCAWTYAADKTLIPNKGSTGDTFWPANLL